MATGITLSTTSNLQSGQKILIAGAMVANEPAAPDPDLIESAPLPKGHYQYSLSTFARLANASALTQGVDLAETQQLVTAVMTITPTEHGMICTPSKRLIDRMSAASVVGTIGKLMGMSLRIREALDVTTLYDGFGKSVGGTGTTLDVAHFRGSVSYLMTDNDSGYGPVMPPLRASLHIEQISDIIMDLTSGADIGSTNVHAMPEGINQELLRNWWRARDRLYGVEVFHSGHVTRDASNDSKGAIFGPNALFIVHETAAEPTEDPDPSARVIEYGLFQVWGEAERADTHGVEIYSNSAATV